MDLRFNARLCVDKCRLQELGGYQSLPWAQVFGRGTSHLRNHLIVGAAALLDSSHRVLVAQRPSVGPMPDVWEFPGGKQRVGEDIRTTTCRELLEELGVIIIEKKLVLFEVIQHRYETFDLVLHLFVCNEWAGQPAPMVHNRLRWVPLKQLLLYPMPPADGPLVEKLRLAFGDTPVA